MSSILWGKNSTKYNMNKFGKLLPRKNDSLITEWNLWSTTFFRTMTAS